jgi:hypothetical protein
LERPQFGAVSPATFIPLAEENGLIQEIGEWVLTTACFQAKHWEDVFPGMRMSVNVSPRQLACDRFANVVGRALANSGLPAQRLELEITEGALIAPNALPSLRALSQMGVSIATLFSGVELCAAIRQDQSPLPFARHRRVFNGARSNWATRAIRCVLAQAGLAGSAHFCKTDQPLLQTNPVQLPEGQAALLGTLLTFVPCRIFLKCHVSLVEAG